MIGSKLYARVVCLCLCFALGDVTQLASEQVSFSDELLGLRETLPPCEAMSVLSRNDKFGGEPSNEDSATGSYSNGFCNGAPVDC